MKQLAEDIKNRSFSKLYLLTGPEAYLRNRYLKALCDAVVPPDDTMNRIVYEGKDIREGEIIDQAETMPFFSERRLIVVRDSVFFKSGADALSDYCAELPDYLVLVFNEEEPDKRGRLYKAVKKYGRVVEFPTQDTERLNLFIAGTLKKNGKKITAQNAAYLLDRVGPDMGRLDRELDKLISYAGDREEITSGDIETLTSPEIENRIFDMISAVTSGQKEKAMAFYADLLALKEAPMRILILIERQYRQMLLIKRMKKEGASDNDIAAACGLPPFVVKKMTAFVRRADEASLRAQADLCIGMEEDVKNGRISDRLSVDVLLIALAR